MQTENGKRKIKRALVEQLAEENKGRVLIKVLVKIVVNTAIGNNKSYLTAYCSKLLNLNLSDDLLTI